MLCYEGNKADNSDEMPLYKRKQHGTKQEELEAVVLLESYDLIAIMETWWDESHDWNVALDGYRLFRRDS